MKLVVPNEQIVITDFAHISLGGAEPCVLPYQHLLSL